MKNFASAFTAVVLIFMGTTVSGYSWFTIAQIAVCMTGATINLAMLNSDRCFKLEERVRKLEESEWPLQ
jgi:amino acid transporter